MGRKELHQQRKLIEAAIRTADHDQLSDTLDGTLGDTQSFCWATLRQFDRRYSYPLLSTPRDHALDHAEKHLLLVMAHDTVRHVDILEKLLDQLGVPEYLPPDRSLRRRIRVARNLLAEHRDERVLYWRLTGNHTPHVIETYQSLGIPLPTATIDSEIIAYSPAPGISEEETERGRASVGTIGDILSLPELHVSFKELDKCLSHLTTRFRTRW